MTSENEVEVSPTIRGDKVVRLEVCGIVWPLKAEIPVREFASVVESIRLLARYVDFSGLAGSVGRGRTGVPWSKEELADFLDERTEGQKVFLRFLAEKSRVTRDEVLRALREALGRPDFGGRDLAGLVAGINMRIGNLGKEPLFKVERRRMGGRLVGIYEVNPRYRDLLLELLSEGR